MMFLFLSLGLVVWLAWLALGSVTVQAGQISRFELRRRQSEGDKSAGAELGRLGLLPAVRSLQLILENILLLTLAVLLSVALGWVVGLLTVLLLVVGRGFLSGLEIWRRPIQRRYKRLEPRLLRLVSKWGGLLQKLSLPRHDYKSNWRLHSEAELRKIIDGAGAVLSPSQQKTLKLGLDFDDKLVSDVMVPRDQIASIQSGELLGPLVLNDLHQTGHSLFPVVGQDLDDIVGVLDIEQLLSLQAKKSLKADKAWQYSAQYILESDSLGQAVDKFSGSRQTILLVQNKSHKTVGLITLADVARAWLGKP